MPRMVRNFWVDLKVDGGRRIATGPRSRGSGFYMRILLREKGSISDRELVVEGKVLHDGRLEILAYEGGKTKQISITTQQDDPNPPKRKRVRKSAVRRSQDQLLADRMKYPNGRGETLSMADAYAAKPIRHLKAVD